MKMSWKPILLAMGCMLFLCSCHSGGPVDRTGRPLICKRGTLDLDLVETTPIVLHGKLYRFAWVRSKGHSRFIDVETGEATAPFAEGCTFGIAYSDGDTVYVSGSSGDDESGWGAGKSVYLFISNDLKTWQKQPAFTLPDFAINNTSLCRDSRRYVMLINFHKPKVNPENSFPGRFMVSADLRTWELLPAECVYTKDHYAAPLCLKYLEPYYYIFYLERLKGRPFETRVSRSKDLITWEESPLDPVLSPSEEDKQIANPRLSGEQRKRIQKAVNINNSDMDFCEYRGRVIINYSWGDQEGKEFFAEAVYSGSEREFLRGWFPEQ